jgi:ribosomal protein L13E
MFLFSFCALYIIFFHLIEKKRKIGRGFPAHSVKKNSLPDRDAWSLNLFWDWR